MDIVGILSLIAVLALAAFVMYMLVYLVSSSVPKKEAMSNSEIGGLSGGIVAAIAVGGFIAYTVLHARRGLRLMSGKY